MFLSRCGIRHGSRSKRAVLPSVVMESVRDVSWPPARACALLREGMCYLEQSREIFGEDLWEQDG